MFAWPVCGAHTHTLSLSHTHTCCLRILSSRSENLFIPCTRHGTAFATVAEHFSSAGSLFLVRHIFTYYFGAGHRHQRNNALHIMPAFYGLFTPIPGKVGQEMKKTPRILLFVVENLRPTENLVHFFCFLCKVSENGAHLCWYFNVLRGFWLAAFTKNTLKSPTIESHFHPFPWENHLSLDRNLLSALLGLVSHSTKSIKQ